MSDSGKNSFAMPVLFISTLQLLKMGYPEFPKTQDTLLAQAAPAPGKE